jgi:pimeloyl-ACP methyl ester carboxylesterase
MTNGPAHRRLELDGVSIFYREAGPSDAPVLFLPHGYPCSSFQFRRLMPALPLIHIGREGTLDLSSIP